jgi:hypothetical protein
MSWFFDIFLDFLILQYSRLEGTPRKEVRYLENVIVHVSGPPIFKNTGS